MIGNYDRLHTFSYRLLFFTLVDTVYIACRCSDINVQFSMCASLLEIFISKTSNERFFSVFISEGFLFYLA